MSPDSDFESSVSGCSSSVDNSIRIDVQSKDQLKIQSIKTFKSTIRFYATFSFALIFLSSFSGFMFLVPLVVDPALATITANFVEKPVQCRVVHSQYVLGKDFK